MSSAATIPGLVATAADKFTTSEALVDGDVRMTYAELATNTERVGRAFLAAGVRYGDRVGVWLPNRYEYVLAVLGAQTIGAAVIPLNTRYRGQEASDILLRSRATGLVVCDDFLDSGYLDMLTRASGDGESGGPVIDGLPHLRVVVDLAPTPHDKAIGWDAFLAAGEDTRDADFAAASDAVTADTIADIMFTSGTTGKPKGAMSAHRQTISVAEAWANGAHLTSDDRYCIINPFFHSFGYKAGFITAIGRGATIYPMMTFDPPSTLRLIQDERITVLPGAPTIFITLMNHPEVGDYDLSSLRFAIAGAASVPESLFSQMLDILGFDSVKQAYGLTECVVAAMSRDDEDPAHIAENTGPVVPELEAKLVDADGNAVAMGSDGELCLRGEAVMLGYFEDEEATRKAIDSDGWFHTGDIARMDEHGCIKITDRIKDMFIVGGFNVYPAEVESTLAYHPDVVEAAVVGVDDERMGTVGKAYVHLREGAEFDSAALTAYARERLANFKVPRYFERLDTFPRNASGKILKTELRG